jgi:hypothetical protein
MIQPPLMPIANKPTSLVSNVIESEISLNLYCVGLRLSFSLDVFRPFVELATYRLAQNSRTIFPFSFLV